MSIYGNKCIRETILKLGKTEQFPSVIFSDYITRINSNCERKIRTFFITENSIFILV